MTVAVRWWDRKPWTPWSYYVALVGFLSLVLSPIWVSLIVCWLRGIQWT